MPVDLAAGLLVLLAVLLGGPAPRLLPRLTALRSVPVASLTLWQAVSLAALVAGLAAAPVAVLGHRNDKSVSYALLAAAILVTGCLLARLLLTGHRTGTALRRARREHRELVDLIGLPSADHEPGLRVLAHPTPTAYCLPGVRSRVVLSDGALQTLNPEELGAVLDHERAHLRYRHDLVLEFFTVLHTAVPERIRSDAGLREVSLLLELHADRYALRRHRPRDLGGALLSLAEGERPGVGLSASPAVGMATARLTQLRDGGPHRLRAAAVLLAAAAILTLPLAVIVLALP